MFLSRIETHEVVHLTVILLKILNPNITCEHTNVVNTLRFFTGDFFSTECLRLLWLNLFVSCHVRKSNNEGTEYYTEGSLGKKRRCCLAALLLASTCPNLG